MDQQLRNDKPNRSSNNFPLGDILVANGHITRPQLEQALRGQTISGKLLGEELISKGHTNAREIANGLALQRKFISLALTASIALSPVVATTAEAAQIGSAMSVSVVVVANTKIQTLFQANHISISAEDVVRGFVDVPAASRFSVISNSRSGYLLQFYPIGDLFESVQITGLGNPVKMGTDGGAVVQRGKLPSLSAIELSFRFALHPDTLPGNYPWPLQLTVHSL